MSQFRDTFSEAESHAHMIVYFPPESVLVQLKLILDEEYGIMIGIINGKIKRVPLEECAGKLKMVSPKDQLVKAAKQIGISFGD